MPSIQFSSTKNEQAFYKDLSQRVRRYLSAHNYSGKGTWLHYVKAALFLGLYWSAYFILLFVALSNLGIIAVYTLLGIIGLLVAFNVSHDACHGSFCARKPLNDLIYAFSFNMLGTNAYLWKMRHNNSHHLFPNVDGCDADIDNNAVIRLSPSAPRRKHHAYQHLYAPVVYLFYTLHWVFYKDFHYLRRKQLANMEDIRHSRSAIAGVLLAKVLYLAYILLIPMLLHPDQIVAILIGFLCMHAAMSYFFLFSNIMNHYSAGVDFPTPLATDNKLPHSWAVHQMATSQDFHPQSPWCNFFFGGFNAHNAHHLFPHIAHVHYSAISKIIKDTAREYGIPYKETTWIKGLIGHFAYLKALGRGA